MAQWLVGLNGLEADLALLNGALDVPDLHIVKRDEGYYLSSPTFDTLPDVEAVREAAESLVPLLNAGAILQLGGFAGVSRGQVLHLTDEGPDVVFAEPITIAGGGLMRVNATIIDAHGQQQPTLLARAIAVGQRDVKVAEVCRYITKEHTWVNLYKVWEAIRDDQGGREQGRGRQTVTGKGWVTDLDWRRFDDSANSSSLSGENARHHDVQPRHNVPPMSLQEADNFIMTLAARWLEEKAAAVGV